MYQLLQSNLTGATPAALDHAAVRGLLEQLPGQAMLVESNTAIPSHSDTLSKVAVFDDSYAYFRISKVEGNLAQNLRSAYDSLVQTNKSKIKGIILDLRFAGGADYAVAAATADCFMNSDQPLLDWAAGSAHATKKSNPIDAPIAILVNSQTTGAAEALAAALREADIGLILGSATAGQANIFKEFTLSDGEKLRIATAQIKLGDGTVLAKGLQPDIAVDATLADEKAYLEDPYKVLHPSAPAKSVSATDTNLTSVNEPSHRPTNEAELVREHASGNDDDGAETNGQPVASEQPAPPVIADAALARALDLLKGLAVIQQSHPG